MASFNLIRSLSTSVASRAIIRPPTQYFGVDGRYATALYSAAIKSKNLEIVEKDLLKLKNTLATDAKLSHFCHDPTIKRHVKVQAFSNVLNKLGLSSQAFNMLQLLAQNGRLDILSKVLTTFEQIMVSHRGEVSCVVTTAKPLDRATERELTGALEKFLEAGQKLHLSLKVDPELIGGMVVSIGDKYIDMSILRKLRFYKAILEQPV
ncbi:ATP synthase subunit O, mitochondrial [Echinococcus granulosus]|uniref:Oligomycin sensitivity conferral protein n=1 Tax=Echinococcus granulosus TaxID=6210 RepID=U6JKF3_ECHGR|nr:ATP synthase subunit O [Echinococcus granulosus]EUB61766.1 ATP synthase subunit O [Echinococcus granulosus]KAH9277665.1 ATP synthase subunit O, mitochondrial [Echinococcus granulosus]CDS24605.1 H transporting ATP synthase O subunit [Echinococcus granulosus]